MHFSESKIGQKLSFPSQRGKWTIYEAKLVFIGAGNKYKYYLIL